MWPLILTGLALVVTFILCAVFYRFALAIDAIFTFLAKLFGYPAKICKIVQQECRSLIPRMLIWPPFSKNKPDEREEYWRGIDVITRLFYLVIGIVIWGGDLPFAIQRNAYILKLKDLTHIPLPLDVLGGALWLAVPTIFGMLLLDALEFTPSGMRLFPSIHKKRITLWVFRVVMFLFLAVAAFDTALFFYFGQLPLSSSLLPSAWKELALTIVLMFGGLLVFAAVLGLAAIGFGTAGLVSVLVGCGFCIAVVFQAVFTLLEVLISGLGEMLTYVQFRSTKLVKPGPITIVTDDVLTLPGVKADADGQGDNIEPDFYEEGKEIIVSKQNIVAFALGQQSLEALEKFLLRLMHIGASDLLLGYGGIDPYHAVQGKRLPKVSGAKLITPPSRSWQVAQGRHGGGEEMFYALSQAVVSEVKNVYSRYANGTILLFVDAELIPGLASTIDMLKGSVPMCKIALVTSLPEPAERDERLQLAYRAVLDLSKRGKVEVTFLTDPRSPFVSSKKDLIMQEKFVALTLAGLAVAHEQYSRNPSFAKLLESFGRLSPIMGFSGATAPVAVGKPVRGWNLLRRINPRKMKPKGIGDAFSVVNEETNMMEFVLRHNEASMSSIPVNTEGHFLFEFVIPIGLHDQRFYDSAEQILNHLRKKFPNGGGIVVCEQGIEDFLLGEGYFCSCICLHPLTKEAFLIEEEEPRELPPGGD